MPFTVYAGPDPESNLRELLHRTPLRLGPVTAVVPDSRSVEMFERMLAGVLGTAFTGHRVLTMEGLARAIVSAGGPVPDTIDMPVKRALVAEIIKRRFGEHSGYSALASFQGFAVLLEAWLADVRSGDASSAGNRELGSAAAAYEVQLRRLGITDHEGWVMRALADDLPERFGASLPGAFIIHGFTDLTIRQALLAGRIIGTSRRSAATIPYDSSRPELYAVPGVLLERYRTYGASVVDVSAPEAAGAVERGFRSGTAGFRDPVDGITVHTFRNTASEADWVAGVIHSMLASGECAPGDIMIAARTRPGFGSPLHAALARNGIPLEGGIPRPLDRHPVIRFILTAIEASMQPFDEGLIRAVRTSSYAAPGRDFDDRQWNCMVEVGSPDDFVSSVRTMLDLLGVERCLDGSGEPLRAASERAAYSRFIGLLDEFAVFFTPLRAMMQAEEFNRLLRFFLRDAFIPDSPAGGKGVLVTDVNTARHTIRPVLFFIGLDIGSFPGRRGVFSLHDPAVARALREHDEREDPFLFLMTFHGASRVFFTFPGIDDEGGDSAMSPYLREIIDGYGERIRTVFHRMVPGAAWEDGSGNRRGGEERLVRFLKEHPPLSRALIKEAGYNDSAIVERVSDAIVRAGAIAGEQGYRIERGLPDLRREWGPERTFTVTALEDYATCPIKFFFARILRLGIEMKVPGEIDPADRGTIIHDILARFHRMLIERGGEDRMFTDRTLLARTMHEACDSVFAGRADAFAGLHPVAASAERRFIRGWMESFIDREIAYFGTEPFRPAYCEVEFGRRTREGGREHPPLAMGEGDETILVEGRIDRIDTVRDGAITLVRVVDYKTGGYMLSNTDLVTGRALQIPLYLEAARTCIVPGSAVHDGVFYLLRDMDVRGYSQERKPLTGVDWEPFIGNARASARVSAEGIRAGLFPAAECGKNDRCGFLPLCRGGRDNSGTEERNADS